MLNEVKHLHERAIELMLPARLLTNSRLFEVFVILQFRSNQTRQLGSFALGQRDVPYD